MSNLLSRLLEVERGCRLLQLKVTDLQDGIVGAVTSQRLSWMGSARFCLSSLTGTVRECPGGEILPGATITFVDLTTMDTLGSVMSNSSGGYSFNPGASSTPTDIKATADLAGFTDASVTFTGVTCGSNLDQEIDMPFNYAHVLVEGCFSSPLPDATVTVTDADNSTLLGTGTADGSGYAGPYEWSETTLANIRFQVSPPSAVSARFASADVTRVWNCTTSQVVVLDPASGYNCLHPCGVPLKNTLTLVDSYYGTVTLTWDSGTSAWRFETTVEYPGFTSLDFDCPASSAKVKYVLTQSGSFFVDFRTIFDGGCPGGDVQDFALAWSSMTLQTDSTCFPFAYTFAGVPPSFFPLYPPGDTVTFTLSEA